jgi:hypothetical protein
MFFHANKKTWQVCNDLAGFIFEIDKKPYLYDPLEIYDVSIP